MYMCVHLYMYVGMGIGCRVGRRGLERYRDEGQGGRAYWVEVWLVGMGMEIGVCDRVKSLKDKKGLVGGSMGAERG